MENTKSFEKNHTCAFTGHRAFVWGDNELDYRCKALKSKLKEAIKKAYDMGYNTFLDGMALGGDMLCADMILGLKNKYKDLRLVCVLPCLEQEKLWNNFDKSRYNYILSQADEVVCLRDSYCDGCMQARDKFMIDNSSRLIAIFSGKKGGTSFTVKLAQKDGLDIEIVNPDDL